MYHLVQNFKTVFLGYLFYLFLSVLTINTDDFRKQYKLIGSRMERCFLLSDVGTVFRYIIFMNCILRKIFSTI
jgi:hypothetical protein